MSILGPIGFKTLVIQSVGGKITSPVHQARWSDLGLLEAECATCKDIPGHNCTCGIYVTLDMFYARDYANEPGSVLLMIEGTGNVEMYTQGFRSQQGFVVAVVNDGIDPMSQRYAADYFKVQIVTPWVALDAVKMQWANFNMEWPFAKEYDTRIKMKGLKELSIE